MRSNKGSEVPGPRVLLLTGIIRGREGEKRGRKRKVRLGIYKNTYPELSRARYVTTRYVSNRQQSTGLAHRPPHLSDGGDDNDV